MNVVLSRDLELPRRSVTEKLGFIGTTGSGKTYAASRLAEEFWCIGAQFIVLDPVGIWYGLRLQADGKQPSTITIPIFGGLHGDVPLEPTGGALVANLIVDRGISVIVDVSQFESDMQKARFAKEFADRFYFRKKAHPSAVHLFLEECQEFVPQNPQKGEEGMLHAFTRMQKLGRNFGIGSSYITQRPQEVNKKALNLAQTLFVFRTTGLHERKSIEAWIQEKGLDQNIAADLPKLPTGNCHVWSPEFLKVSKVVTIAEKRTFNASATPEVGAKAKDRHLAPIDLERIKTDMAATIEKAKADDPRALRAKIVDLEKRLHLAKNVTAPKSEPTIKEVPIFTKEQMQTIEGIGNYMRQHAETIASDAKVLIVTLQRVMERLTPIHHDVRRGESREAFERDRRGIVNAQTSDILDAVLEGKLPTGERKILTALAQYPQGRTKVQIAILAGYAHTGGGFNNYLSALKSKGWMRLHGENFQITPAGECVLGPVEPLPTGYDLCRHWQSRLSSGEWKILDYLVQQAPAVVDKERLAEQLGYAVNGGGFNNYLSKLRTLELIEGRNELRASEVFSQ